MSKSHYIIDPDEPTRQPMGCGRSLGIFIAVVLLLAAIAAFFPSCKSQTVVQSVEKVRVEKEIIRDTTIVTRADSASLHALFECDSTNQVVLRELETLQGSRIKVQPVVQTTGKALDLTVDCKEDSLQNVIHLKDRIIEDLSNRTETVTERIHYRTGYDRFCSWFFWIVLIILLAVGAFWICDKIPATKPYTAAIKGFFKLGKWLI